MGYHNYYDVIIVGAGPAGIYASYELTKINPNIRLLLIDKGQDIYRRSCPIHKGFLTECPTTKKFEYQGCYPTCALTGGWGGSGAFSDGKFNITTDFGGWMNEYLDRSELLSLIEYVDEINLYFGATQETHGSLEISESIKKLEREIDDLEFRIEENQSLELKKSLKELKKRLFSLTKIHEIEQKATSAGMKLLKAKVRHLGTEENLKILTKIYEYLKDKLEIRHRTKVKDIIIEDKHIKGVILENDEHLFADFVYIAPGRDGSEWLANILKKQNLKLTNNQVDIGVRVEVSNTVMTDINEHLYEAKLIYNTPTYSNTVRTFCANPSGRVVIENHSGIMTVNGHAYKNDREKQFNTNLALLVSHHFTEPFDEPIQYAKYISKLANMLSNGNVIIQRYGDLKKGRRSTEKRIKKGFVEPTLKTAVPGDLALVLPHRTITSIIEMIEALDKVSPGFASEHTLLYGVEAKFYSARPKLSNTFETEIKGLYVGGDGAGITRGLSQASACGVVVARDILQKLKK
ncbi:FAD-dependent oxidoreductase [Vulcanibacillus modesticaldus]|uniref:FAD-dependent oxidoreductase n=1 Tax=Vulcanibacillus modesticaldus TaxID=337097 RepID=A0A1D2YWD2_9BACI|nr:NAD(P)/FAD-dependent oxidoreductase [Vulcanibacillus modesticaldus]OEG00002.1 FAD-dependent oxidoreductase [Vulcanibacillus modesticaldus]